MLSYILVPEPLGPLAVVYGGQSLKRSGLVREPFNAQEGAIDSDIFAKQHLAPEPHEHLIAECEDQSLERNGPVRGPLHAQDGRFTAANR